LGRTYAHLNADDLTLHLDLAHQSGGDGVSMMNRCFSNLEIQR
jgi:hypothetical protein